jgi:motility quorum-sensing regulator/GCU-specific mRNA interferase toxin
LTSFSTVAGLRMTRSALTASEALGLTLSDVVALIQGLTREQFYKSMTSLADHRIWQDVYRPRTAVGDVYLKLTVIDDLLIVSFKEL